MKFPLLESTIWSVLEWCASYVSWATCTRYDEESGGFHTLAWQHTQDIMLHTLAGQHTQDMMLSGGFHMLAEQDKM